MKDLKTVAKEVRKRTVECIGSLGVGHIGGCLSVVELLTVLYEKHMNIDVNNSKMEGRDRLIVSKGHAGPALYAMLSIKGFISHEDLFTLNKGGTKLPSHCDMKLTNGVDMTTGSLGQGFSMAVGVAQASKIVKDGAFIYSIIGDGESQEGQIWEAGMYAGAKGLDNLIAFTDYNKYQIDGSVDEVCTIAPLDKKWEAFGFEVYTVDGHDLVALDEVIAKAKTVKGKPKMIILNTIKGKGISFVEEAKAGNHNMPITKEQLEIALKEIEEN